jgi:hypothetical protein
VHDGIVFDFRRTVGHLDRPTALVTVDYGLIDLRIFRRNGFPGASVL